MTKKGNPVRTGSGSDRVSRSFRDHRGNNKTPGILVYVLLLAVAFTFRVAIARFYPNDSPDDGKLYSQIARNVLERHVYSHESEPPFGPSLIRLPGYPLFLAGVYSVFGHHDDGAVRIMQALVDTATCGLIALVAFWWEPDEKRKRAASIAALALAALCPFTTIYVATILTETLTNFFAVAMCLTATLALRASVGRNTLWLWLATGLLAGVAVMFRPDSGLFALAIGLTLVVATLSRSSDVRLTTKRDEFLYRTARASYLGAVFSLAFCLVLVPWAVRNYRVFHLFQPLAPAHAEMPGEFVPRGYLLWLRTWIDNGRYIGPVLWSLDSSPIKLTDIPDGAFDSAEEKQRVAALLEKYNHPNPESELFAAPADSEKPTGPENPTGESESASPADEASPGDEGDEEGSDEEESTDQSDDKAAPGQSGDQAVEMTPEIDAGFAQLARERIERHSLRYYVWLPLKRAHSLWFDTHSQYYPFEGELLPLDHLDRDLHQQYWLPLFAALTAIYTLLGIAGAWRLLQTGQLVSQQWVLLAALIIFLRLGFFATLENPEPRYVVEIFPFLTILSGIAAVRLGAFLKTSRKT